MVIDGDNDRFLRPLGIAIKAYGYKPVRRGDVPRRVLMSSPVPGFAPEPGSYFASHGLHRGSSRDVDLVSHCHVTVPREGMPPRYSAFR